jgi:hypothetical protein
VGNHDEAEVAPIRVRLTERLGSKADGSEHYRDEQRDQLCAAKAHASSLLSDGPSHESPSIRDDVLT